MDLAPRTSLDSRYQDEQGKMGKVCTLPRSVEMHMIRLHTKDINCFARALRYIGIRPRNGNNRVSSAGFAYVQGILTL